MKQTSGFISTYSADSFGVCSALYELGGMVVMHDASGCNSTYTTHDEPRWYDMDSMVYISALTEIEAIMGDDSRLINDIVEAALELMPKFIAIAGTPIPAMTGFDADAAAKEIEDRTGILSFGFATTGMKSYTHGAGMAFKALAERVAGSHMKRGEAAADETISDQSGLSRMSMNILGLTPLDFSINGSDKSLRHFYEKKGYRIVSSWAMGAALDDIRRSGEAGLNQVVSETGYEAACSLKKLFGIPFRIGLPIGGEDFDVTRDFLKSMGDGILICFDSLSVPEGENGFIKESAGIGSSDETADGCMDCAIAPDKEYKAEILVMGERVFSLSLAKYLNRRLKKTCAGYAATDSDEDEIISVISRNTGVRYIIADPLFEPALKLLPGDMAENITFIQLPHEAFSGRLFRNEIPDLISDTDALDRICSKMI